MRDRLAAALVNQSAQSLLTNDMNKLRATINKDDTENTRDGLKADAYMRILLLLGSCPGTVSGIARNGKTGALEYVEKPASDLNLPIGVYMAGHGGRNALKFEKTNAKRVLEWVAGGKDGIHDTAYSLADNRESTLSGKEIVFDRHAATHSYKGKGNDIQELKGIRYGVSGIVGRIANPRVLLTLDQYTMVRWVTYPLAVALCATYNAVAALTNTFGARLPLANPFSKHSEHFGFNIGIGGAGNQYMSDPTKTISSDGKSGHVYMNVKGNIMGVGLEGAAPRTSGALGSHSASGAADQFSAAENEKFAIKFGSSTFKSYIKNYLDTNNILGNKILNSYLQGSKYKKEDLVSALKDAGLDVVKQGKSDYLLTNLGSNVIKRTSDSVLPDNYGGLKVNYNKAALDEVMKIDVKSLPNELPYFKPQNDLASFMKQKEIFKDIDNKPLLKNNPDLSLETCIKLSALYEVSTTGRDAEKQKAQERLQDIEQSLGRAINSSANNKIIYDAVDKHPHMKGLDGVVDAYRAGQDYVYNCERTLAGPSQNRTSGTIQKILNGGSKAQESQAHKNV